MREVPVKLPVEVKEKEMPSGGFPSVEALRNELSLNIDDTESNCPWD